MESYTHGELVERAGAPDSSPPSDVRTPLQPTGRQPTLKDVAAALGVSPMTVSNAYNRPDQIAPATRARVFATAARLGYPGPHPTARSLRRRHAGAVGLLYDNPLSVAVSDPAAVLVLQGISQATEAAHLGLLLLSGSALDAPPRVARAVVDGLITFALAEDDPLLSAALERRLPLVLVDQPAPAGITRVAIASVGIDDADAARAAAAHVADLGHRRVGIIALGLRGGGDAGQPQPSGPAHALRQIAAKHPVAPARLRGYAAALAEVGVPWADVPVYECGGLAPEDGAQAAAWLLDRTPRPTALLAMSDQLALGAMDAARARGLGIPGDLSVMGFDDIPAAARATPGLTTVRQPHVEKGQWAGRLLVTAIQGLEQDQPRTIVLPTALVVRGSTGRAALR